MFRGPFRSTLLWVASRLASWHPANPVSTCSRQLAEVTCGTIRQHDQMRAQTRMDHSKSKEIAPRPPAEPSENQGCPFAVGSVMGCARSQTYWLRR